MSAGAGGISVGGPTPWWQLPGNGAARKNLEISAPDGYEYDPVQMAYKRTPTSAGQRAGAFQTAALDAMPSMKGLMDAAGGAMSGMGTGSSSFGGGGGVNAGPTGVGGGVPTSTMPTLQLPDTRGAEDAAFGAAKDKAGKIARSSIDSLNGELGAQNMIGSGAQVEGTRGAIESAAQYEGDAVRDATMKRVDLASDFAKTGYEGGIAQRGQDISAATTRRGQDVAAQEAQARLALETRQAQYQQLNLLLNSIGKMGGGAAADSAY